MIQEEKDLLLNDLCGRLPYAVSVKYKSREKEGITTLGYGNISYVNDIEDGWWLECKPYLRPMSSMTKEENKEYDLLIRLDEEYAQPYDSAHLIDWLNKHHFDYRGLIEKGLALDAPEGMYKQN